MMKGKSIVCMPLTVWDSAITNTMVQLMILLSKENNVLFVDYQYTVKDVFLGIRKNKNIPVKRILGLNQRLRKVTTAINTELHVLTCPPVLPVNWIKSFGSYRKVLNVNASLIKRSVENAINQLQMKDVIVVNGYNPFLGLPLKGAFKELLNIYYCYDEIKGDKWYAKHGPSIEEQYLKSTDLVITTSDGLYNSKVGSNPNCRVVKNGVDFDLFNSVANKEKTNRSHLIVGYTGSIDQRFDIEVMENAVINLPNVKFQLIGRIAETNAKEVLGKYPNVEFTGAKKPREIPEYIKEFDACIIPYYKNELTYGVYPLKINEYLAAGKPVVMMNFGPLQEFQSVVKMANSKEEFLQLLRDELMSEQKDKKEFRIAFAKNNSWERRVDEFSLIIDEYLNKKINGLYI